MNHRPLLIRAARRGLYFPVVEPDAVDVPVFVFMPIFPPFLDVPLVLVVLPDSEPDAEELEVVIDVADVRLKVFVFVIIRPRCLRTRVM